MKSLSQIAPVLVVATLIGCSKSEVVRSPFVHRGAVFHAEAGPDTATSPVEKSCSVDEEGRPKGYRGGMLLLQGAVRIRYEFVGTTFCPASADGRQWDEADVYALVITQEEARPETIPLVYRGGELVVVDRPDLRVVLKQGASQPAPAADPTVLDG